MAADPRLGTAVAVAVVIGVWGRIDDLIDMPITFRPVYVCVAQIDFEVGVKRSNDGAAALLVFPIPSLSPTILF